MSERNHRFLVKFSQQVVAVLCAIASFTPITSAQEAPTLRVLCYNIHYGQGMDGVYDVERLAAVINRSKPDLVALQEVDVSSVPGVSTRHNDLLN